VLGERAVVVQEKVDAVSVEPPIDDDTKEIGKI